MALEEHYEDYKNLSKQITESEKVFFVNDPYSIPIIHSAAQEASNETKRLFGINGHNDLSDAFRHCYFAAMLSRDLGYYDALDYLNAHESSPNNPIREKRMDTQNNYIGADIGRTQKRNSELSAMCFQAAQGGKLALY
ncbi:DUF6973 domain-containing protein [Xenorhabdus bovienii]|uniref:DUF6973 domain-containing protein n=1 Tax=Xenorhabdus bovienii TaxID=40576 RepID=UPI00237CD28F|nr:hypothetical protein [Xenorhabdus bovienii]MDE1474930.1 hypothetical protein [Xenorhabdus bovienii]MDE1482202.1 hypothetical protein [Xenorhabdus bovienii]MDE9428935.1 hypothetical protein [Xenorhabdus bovienii]MDE9432889.1 hypothetical protein [Xenorhabdus bovienii]MDE9442299.1 hypothetical protein [Xenorhabdus bovienii]